MPDWRYRKTAPEKRAKQQIRDLGKAVRKTVKELDKSYPNGNRSDRILRAHRQRVAEIVQRGRRPPSRHAWQRNGNTHSPVKPLTPLEVLGLFVFATVFLAVALTARWLCFFLAATSGL
jgi:hypothetical protein